MRKHTITVILILVFSLVFPLYTNAVSFNPSLDIYSEAVYMINLDTNQVVYKKNENKQLHPASLTKIMTAVLVLEHFKDNPDVMKTTYASAPSVAYDDFVGQIVSTADIRINEKVNYNDLLYALLLPSACEAANIIAYNLGNGNINEFVKMMNDKAAELGCNDTTFANAHGLHDENQLTTAYDMSKIVQYAMTLPKFMEIASTTQYTLEPTEVHKTGTFLKHTNAMLQKDSQYYYKYAMGIKTGTLDEAGRCLVSTAEKDGVKYLVVSMNAPMTDNDGNSVFYNCVDHTTLYEWAFNKLVNTKILDKMVEVGKIEVQYGKDASHVLVKPVDEFSTYWPEELTPDVVKQTIISEEIAIAPVEEGQKLGKLELVYNGEIIFSTDLVATTSIERDNLKYMLSLIKAFPSSDIFKYAAIITGAIFVLYSIIFIINANKKKSTFKPKRRKIIKR